MRTVTFFRTESGRCPTEEFLDSLNVRRAQKALWTMRLIEELDVVPRTFLKKLVDTDGIWEIRVPAGEVTLRFLGYFEGPSSLIISHGFPKKSRKTPKKEIALAEKRRREHGRRSRR